MVKESNGCSSRTGFYMDAIKVPPYYHKNYAFF